VRPKMLMVIFIMLMVGAVIISYVLNNVESFVWCFIAFEMTHNRAQR